jgi:hypothetical protein
MKDQTEIFVFTSPEVEQFLLEYRIDLVSLLQQQGVEVDYGFSQDPVATDVQEKSPSRVIIASAAFVLALTPLLSQVIQSVSPKGIVVHELRCIPTTDVNGNVVLDKSGNPIMKWVRKEQLQEFTNQVKTDPQVSLKGPLGIEVTYSNSSTQTSSK